MMELGIKGEREVCQILRKKGFPIRRYDGHMVIKNKLYFIEVKNKSRAWNPPPFWGHGIDEDQLLHYLSLYSQFKIRTILFVPSKDEKTWVWNFIDILNKGRKHKTQSKIIVFPFEEFNELEELGNEMKLSDFMRGVANE